MVKGQDSLCGFDARPIKVNQQSHFRHLLFLIRSFQSGRMKTQTINGEEWPPSVEETGVQMMYPPDVPQDKQFAMGNMIFASDPGKKNYH